ncbi:ACP phosphodiesterase [Oceaniferula spumae]|uniref:ACP phosphodiesterase n=1 Tax=Oceaniferula spumae TaxID=2979115 RepID=A0AAT9FRQ7_9BACT
MNYLAHLLLADDSDASRIGNLLGDFTRGSIKELADIYPPELVRGIRMHRAVDRFTDSHPVFKQCRTLLAPERRRFAGIIVDIFFDHYLCKHWADYSKIPLEEFCQQVYHAFELHPEWRAGRLATAYPMMKSENWLMTYATVDGIELTLQRVSRRSPRIGRIADGIEDFKLHYVEFENHFLKYMPELVEFVREWKRNH